MLNPDMLSPHVTSQSGNRGLFELNSATLQKLTEQNLHIAVAITTVTMR